MNKWCSIYNLRILGCNSVTMHFNQDHTLHNFEIEVQNPYLELMWLHLYRAVGKIGSFVAIPFKVTGPILDHLSDFGIDHDQYEAMQIFSM